MYGFIKSFHTDTTEIKVILRLSGIFLTAFVLYLAASYFIIRSFSLHDIKQYLKDTATSMSEDFEYSNGVWNTDRYLSDPTTPSETPFYIFSLDGFLIDRMNVIRGFLDTSNFTYASSFVIPQTIISPIGEHWRVFSYPVERNGGEKGVILLAYFEPDGRSEEELDIVLLVNAKRLDSQISITNELIDVSRVIDKEIDHNISYEVVDTFNRSYKSIGGPPAYIDKSYLQDIFAYKDFTIISDARSKKRYIVHREPIVANGKTVGIVVLGKGLDQLNQILANQLVLSFAAGLLSVLIFAIFTIFIYRHDIRTIIEKRLAIPATLSFIVVERIALSTTGDTIIINDRHMVEIPPDSYQHDICKLLFNNPKKQYDTLDLSDAMGELDEQKNVKRLVYDAVEAVNTKVKKLIGIKLIAHTDKKYFVNPALASKFI